jgi:N-methylhydantoinase B
VSASILERDPVTFEVVRGGLSAICEEMKSVMTRASFSPLLSLSADLSCALLDAEGEVVAQGNDIPVHLGAMPFTGRGVLAIVPREEWRPGDAVLTNDPYLGGTHLPDMTLMTAIFDESGLLGFAASRVHWPDVGGSAAGSSTVTDDIVKEGIRIPPVRILRDGALDAGLARVLFANMRVPDDRIGDLRAQIACNERGAHRVGELVRRYGGEAIRDVMSAAQSYSRLQVEQALESLADGEYRAECHLDGDGYVTDRGDGDLRLRVTIVKKGRSIACDFQGTSAQTRGPVNAPLAVTASAAYYVLLAIAGGAAPPNSGAYAAMRIAAPEGSLVNPRPPAPVVAANTETSNRLADLLLDALSPALGDAAIGGSYGSAGVFTVGGWDPVRERAFVHLETIGGGMGASRNAPGLNGHRVHMGNTMNLPAEAVEASLPVRIEAYELIEGSGGEGRNAGGMGVRRVVRALADGIEFSVLSERALHPAPGAAGARSGKPARFYVERAAGGVHELASKTVAGRLGKGDRLVIETAGGGGWGAPPA